MHLPTLSPPKSGRSRGKIITMEGLVTSSNQKPETQVSPQKLQITSPIAHVQITPPKVQMHQISPQPSPARQMPAQMQMNCSRQVPQLNPVHIMPSPQSLNLNGPTVMQSSTPRKTVVHNSPKSSLGFVLMQNIFVYHTHVYFTFAVLLSKVGRKLSHLTTKASTSFRPPLAKQFLSQL